MRRFSIIFVMMMLAFCQSSVALEFRMQGDRVWMKAKNASVVDVLEAFRGCNVEVLVDPSLSMTKISGSWENTKTDRFVEQISGKYGYLLKWRKLKGPLGALYQLASIKIYSPKNPEGAKPLSKKERVLDVMTGTNGVQYLRGEVLVGFSGDASVKDLNALLKKVSGTVIEVINPMGIYRIKLPEGLSVEAALALIKKMDHVKGAEPNLAFKRMDVFHTPYEKPVTGMNLHLRPGETAVAVFDSGLDPKYAQLSVIRGSYNAVDPESPMSDPLGHGTLTALVASGVITPAGASPAETGVPVLAVRTFDKNGMTSSDILFRAMDFAAKSNVKYVSMSWGAETSSAFIQAAMNYAVKRGLILYASAGNKPTGVPIYPAGYPNVRAIGGLDPSGARWEKSNFGDFVEEYAPAFANLNGVHYEGTSVSAPRAVYEVIQREKEHSNPK